MKTKVLSLLFACCCFAQSAGAETPSRALVLDLLRGYEPMDTAQTLAKLGPEMAPVLIDIIQDRRVPALRRVRAIEALGLSPTTASQAFLGRLVAERKAQRTPLADYELLAAARALGSFGASAIAELSPLLSHRNADVRDGAVYGLNRIGTKEAQALVTAYIKGVAQSKAPIYPAAP